ncbi:MAG: hypothetical protein ACI9ON_000375 [Limisphaerales bacterium]|jgi:hypothetical protein
MQQNKRLHNFDNVPESGRWNPELLAKLRTITDPPADEVIAEFFAQADAPEPHALFAALLDERIPGADSDLAPVSQHLLQSLADKDPIPPLPDVDFAPAQALLRDQGPEIMMMLGGYSLPMAYSAANGAAVLAQTGYLEKRVMRRLVETAQLVIDVLQPGGLEPSGNGIRSAREVRLLHAAIRYLIDKKGSWDPEKLGKPINQEDLAGTLMVFSAVVLDGFDKLGIDIDKQTGDSYIQLWRYVGQVMGLVPELLPDSQDQARELTWMIYDSQMGGSTVGCQLMTSLLSTMKENMPFAIARQLPPSIVRIFMLREAADELRVPRRPVLDFVTRILFRCLALLDHLLLHFGVTRHFSRWFSRRLIHMLLQMGRGDERRATFEIPLDLHAEWRLTGKK